MKHHENEWEQWVEGRCVIACRYSSSFWFRLYLLLTRLLDCLPTFFVAWLPWFIANNTQYHSGTSLFSKSKRKRLEKGCTVYAILVTWCVGIWYVTVNTGCDRWFQKPSGVYHTVCCDACAAKNQSMHSSNFEWLARNLAKSIRTLFF